MRVYYDRRGRVRGYSSGLGGYYLTALFQLAGTLLVIAAVMIAVAALAAVVVALFLVALLVSVFSRARGAAMRRSASGLWRRGTARARTKPPPNS